MNQAGDPEKHGKANNPHRYFTPQPDMGGSQKSFIGKSSGEDTSTHSRKSGSDSHRARSNVCASASGNLLKTGPLLSGMSLCLLPMFSGQGGCMSFTKTRSGSHSLRLTLCVSRPSAHLSAVPLPRAMTSSMSLPLVVWHNFINPNTTCLICCSNNVYAGQKDGNIWVYGIVDGNPPTLQHKFLLVGHNSPVVALCIAAGETDALSKTENVLISASEDGEIARWQTSDGRCQAVNASGFLGVPQQLKRFSQFSDKHIFCCGRSNEVYILNATTLEVVRVWGGHPNWVACTDIYDADARRTRLVTITNDGDLDIWDFDSSTQSMTKVFGQSRLVQLHNVYDSLFDLVSDKDTPELFMVLTNRSVMLFSHKDMKFVPQVTIPAKANTSWTGGVFLGANRFAVWTEDGNVYEYILKPPEGIRPGSMAVEERQLYYSAVLVFTYELDSYGSGATTMSGAVHMAIYKSKGGSMAVVAFCNQPEASTFTVQPLGTEESRDTQQQSKVVRTGTTFRDIWPLTSSDDPNFGTITATSPVSSNHIAIGYESGTICVVPLAMALMHMRDISKHTSGRQDVRVFEHAHDGQVTCMLVSDHHGSGHQYLLSGGRDGAVKIWNLIDGKYVASFTVHVVPVEAFVEPAEQTDSHIRGCVASIAKDNSLALISVDSMTCLYVFPGHPYPLQTIQWRTSEDYVLLGYSDDVTYVWQLQTAHLDRVIRGKTSKDILADDRWPTNRIPIASKVGQVQKQNVSIRSITSSNHASPISALFAHVFTCNIQKLSNDLSVKGRAPDLWMPPALEASVSTSSMDAIVPEVVNDKNDRDDPLDGDLGDGSVPRNSMKAKTKIREKRLELASTVLSVAVSWGISDGLEDTCRQSLQLTLDTPRNVCFGLRGTGNHLSLLAPLAEEKDAWRISRTMTATRLLAIALLSKTVIHLAGQPARTADLMSGYAMSLPLVVGENYCFPSLSLLSKHWQDPSARSLFSSAVNGLEKKDILSLVDYWEAFLPASSTSSEEIGASMMARASIVLGIMGCDQPQTLNPRVRKSTALSLTLLLSDSELDDTRNPEGGTAGTEHTNSTAARTLASMELLSQGFSVWESFINASEVLRTLFQYASDPQPTTALLTRGAKGAIFEIARTNMPLVIGTLTFDAMNGKNIETRVRCLQIIHSFIRKKPLLLYADVYRVVEAAVKTLDPNVPQMREYVLPHTTTMLHDLVKTYPFVDFSRSTQKLATGTLEGASVIYDLRTTTRMAVLEGHAGPVSALSFSPDAKYIATCSLLDQTVRVWYSNQSLLGFLSNSLSHSKHHDHGSAQKPYKTFSFALPNGSMDSSDIIRHVRFEWTSTRGVKLVIRDLVMSFTV